MNLLSVTGILLLSSNASVIFGSSIRGGGGATKKDQEQEQERNLSVSLKSHQPILVLAIHCQNIILTIPSLLILSLSITE